MVAKPTLSLSLKLALIFSFISSVASAQKFDSLLNILDSKYPQEKIYLQYDRPYYNPGETIWFKAYLMAGNMPSPISNTLYTEMLDDKGNILQQKTIPIIGAGAASAFDIPDNIASPVVYVRAYTSWSLNFDTSFIYYHPVRIIRQTPAPKDKPTPRFTLTFFPEGGDLVNSMDSKVAFKATDNQGLPVKIKADIVDSKNQKISSFADTHDGMGMFKFKPMPGEKYKAIWKNKNGGAEETMLPVAKDAGVVLSILNLDHSLQFTLRRSEDAPANYKALQVVAQMQQQPVYTAKINLSAKMEVTAPIPTTELPDGIMQITVFSDDGMPLAERIVFVNNGNSSFITDLHATEKNLTKRAKNVLQIDVGDTLTTNLSIAVTDAGTSSDTYPQSTIFSELLLTSDIKGYVHNPAYYFSDNSDSVRNNLDLVMMTNGWRRFKWEEIVKGNWPVIRNPLTSYLSVKGHVLGLRESELVGKDLSMILKTKSDQVQVMTVPVNAKGEFLVNDLFFYDTAKLYYQFNNDKNKVLTTRASFDFLSERLQFPYRGLPLAMNQDKAPGVDSAMIKKNLSLMLRKKNDFVEGQKVKTLEGVKVQAKVKSLKDKMDEDYASGFFRGGDGYTFLTADDPLANGAMTVLDYLRGKVAGLQITGSGASPTLSWRGSTPSLFLNEMNTDISLVQSTSMSDVAMIKVFRPPFFGAVGGGAGGAIAIYTKKGEQANSSVKGLDFVALAGYTPTRQFYSPDYSTEEDKDKSDFRTTLYWNPYIVFDKKTRRLVLPFYNNDNCQRIRVVIEGINEEGKLTREEKIFE